MLRNFQVDADAARGAQELRDALRSMSENGPVSDTKIEHMLLAHTPHPAQPSSLSPNPSMPHDSASPLVRSTAATITTTIARNTAAPGQMYPISGARKPAMTFGRRHGT